MQVELSKEELKEILHWSSSAPREWSNDALVDRLSAQYKEAEELESLDFDDCAGGACKL